MSDDAPTQTLPTAPSPQTALPLTGFAAGISGAALVTAGVWGLHVLTPGGGAVGSVGWVVLLCLAFTALGKGVTLLRRALAPLTAAAVAPLAGISAPVRAAAGIVIGAAGIWWVMRGHAATWWTRTIGTGDATGWTLTSQLVAVAFMVVFGALLFGGAKTLFTLIFANSGTRERSSQSANQQRWVLWWSSHPGLGLTLLAGGATLVFLSGYIVPRVSAWLTGPDPMAALAAIAAILTVAFAANTWWWKALTGWWQWAHTHGSGGGGASPLGQMHASAAVIALIWFSAMGFGLATPADYTGPGAAPRALADCPPDCGGGSNGSNSYGPNASQFQPPQMPAQQPDYQSGLNQPPLDQNSGISIYNQNPGQGGQSGPQQAGQNIGQQAGQRAAHGEPLPNYGPWQPDAQPPAQAPQPVQQAPAQQPAVQQPAQAPQNPAGQQPAQAPQNPAGQQPVQQQPGVQQQPQGQPGQQPAQQNPPQQTQPGQQQPQNPSSQQSPQQQAPQKGPDAPKKSPMDPTDLATAATRRGSQQAGDQAAQQGTQQAVQQAPKSPTQAQQTPQTTQQSQQIQQAPKQTKQIQGKPKGIDGAAKQGTPEEKPWDITGELKPINKNFPDGSEKLGVEGRYGLQNKDPVSIGKTTMGEYSFQSTFQQKLGGEVEASAVLNPQNGATNPPAVLPKAEAFAGYDLENKNLIAGPGVQGIITNTLKIGPDISQGATTGTPIGATTAFQNLGNGNFYVNLPLAVTWRQVEVDSTIQGVVNVPELIQGTLGKAGQWITSGIPSMFGP